MDMPQSVDITASTTRAARLEQLRTIAATGADTADALNELLQTL